MWIVEPLPEVAAPVEEADPDERHAQLGGCLESVAREHAEPARVDGEALVEPELEREVRDQQVSRPAPLPPPRLLAAVARQAPLHPRQPLQVVRRERAGEIVVRQLRKQRGRVVMERGEAPRLELGEEWPRFGDPREGEVARDLEECRAQRRAVVCLAHRPRFGR